MALAVAKPRILDDNWRRIEAVMTRAGACEEKKIRWAKKETALILVDLITSVIGDRSKRSALMNFATASLLFWTASSGASIDPEKDLVLADFGVKDPLKYYDAKFANLLERAVNPFGDLDADEVKNIELTTPAFKKLLKDFRLYLARLPES